MEGKKMKRKNNYLKEASVLLIATIMISTSMIVIAENKIHNNSNDYEIVMFIQEPEIPENEPLYLSGDIDDIWRPYDDFWDLTSPIREIQWWNIAGRWEINDAYPSDPEGSIFTITFCEDDGTGKPGDIICTYENVIATITGTGIMYDQPSEPTIHGPYELYYFETVLSSSCVLSDGWVSILKTDSIHDWHGGIILSKDGNDFCWSYNVDAEQWWDGTGYDFSFALYGYVPDLSCDGSLSWADVKTGETKTGTITVENIGGSNSLLDWKVETNMDWGDWTFTPESGDDLTPEDGPVTISVNVTAPDEKNKEFTGEIHLVNKNDEQDKCTIPVTLTTSKTKAIKTPFLTFLENHPHLFPLLRQILGL